MVPPPAHLPMRVGGALEPPAAAWPLLPRRTIPAAGAQPLRNRGRRKGADLHAAPARGERPSRHNQQVGASLDQEAAGVPRTEERPSQAGIPAPIRSADCSSARPAARPSPRAEPQRTDSCAKMSPCLPPAYFSILHDFPARGKDSCTIPNEAGVAGVAPSHSFSRPPCYRASPRGAPTSAIPSSTHYGAPKRRDIASEPFVHGPASSSPSPLGIR